MKNILKFLFAALLIPMLLTSCRNEDFSITGNPAPSFKLYDTTLGSNVLYPTSADNTFRLVWDESVGSTQNYTVVLSTTEDFKTPVVFGTTKEKTFVSTIGHLNDVLIQSGYSPYTPQRVYFRIEAPGSSAKVVSNSISFDVTPYPAAKPIITNPTAGSALVLNSAAPNTVATTIKWTDYATYGVPVKYLVEIAKKGSTTYYPLATVTGATSLDVTNLMMDQIALKAGGTANLQEEYNVRVTATSVSTGGTIQFVSDVVTFKVTPYQLEAFLYAPGAYQGWNPSTAEALRSATSNGIYIGYINFTSPNSEFKVNPARNWDNSYGSTGGNNITYNGGSNLVAPNVGYQKLTVNTNNNTYALEAYSWGVIGSATPGGWNDDTDLMWNSTTQKWEINNIALTVGEIKFRLNNDWGTNYGDDGNNGSIEPGGANIPITEAGNYKLTLDLENMVWTKTKL